MTEGVALIRVAPFSSDIPAGVVETVSSKQNYAH